jgi:hypothetical protein
MNELIEALQIFAKYTDTKWPTHCEHDVLWICGVEPDKVTEEDKKRLDELGFFIDEEDNYFKSFHFGSA